MWDWRDGSRGVPLPSCHPKKLPVSLPTPRLLPRRLQLWLGEIRPPPHSGGDDD